MFRVEEGERVVSVERIEDVSEDGDACGREKERDA